MGPFGIPFPESGRIDYLNGSIEVDMSPEDLFVHGRLKATFVRVLNTHAVDLGLGYVFTWLNGPISEFVAREEDRRGLDTWRSCRLSKRGGIVRREGTKRLSTIRDIAVYAPYRLCCWHNHLIHWSLAILWSLLGQA